MPQLDPSAISQIFNEQFQALAGEKVVLYGLGVISEALVKRREHLCFEIVGLLDRDRTDGFFHGLPIIKPERTPDSARHVVITASIVYCWMIYQRVAFLESRGVRIYFPNGRCCSERGARKPALDYLGNVFGALFEKIKDGDLISFDIFDTLLMRKCLTPEMVPALLERRLGLPGLARARHEAALRRHNDARPNYKLAEAYEYGFGLNILPPGRKDIMEAELALEAELCVPRDDLAAAFNYAKSLGKTVILVSDMYLPADFLRGLLDRGGISG